MRAPTPFDAPSSQPRSETLSVFKKGSELRVGGDAEG